MNFTLTLPAGSTNHGDPSLVCLPPLWTDYFVFFATNYFAHVGTLVMRPGESRAEVAVDILNALFVPGSGALRAWGILVAHATPQLRKWDPLREAAKAGALVMAVKRENLVGSGGGGRGGGPDGWFQRVFDEDSAPAYVPSRRTVFGRCKLPPAHRGRRGEYVLVEVPPHVPLCPYQPGRRRPHSRLPQHRRGSEEREDRGNRDRTSPNEHGFHHATPKHDAARRSSSSSRRRGANSFRHIQLGKASQGPKAIISILQIVWSGITLYRTRGAQVSLYGYGALALTVTPYTIMSVVNLGCNLLRANFTSLYLVHTPDMDAARADGGAFWGMVAALDVEAAVREGGGLSLSPGGPRSLPAWLAINGAGYLAVALVPILLIAVFTHFAHGSTTTIPTEWILAWIVVGSTSALYISFLEKHCRYLDEYLFLSIPLWVPAIGGFIVAGQIFRDFGNCTAFRSS
jgi:hypothetical protein